MLDSPTSAFSADFKTRYRGCYGFYHGTSQKHLVYIKEVAGKVAFQDVAGVDYYANYDQGVTFEFLPVTRGWHHTARGPRYLQRIAARQYQRGISRNNTTVYGLDVNGAIRQVAITFEDLQDIFVDKPQQNSLQEYLDGSSKSFIINKFFLLVKDRVYMYDNMIGTISPKDRKIYLDASLYAQELKDAIARQQLNIEVTHG